MKSKARKRYWFAYYRRQINSLGNYCIVGYSASIIICNQLFRLNIIQTKSKYILVILQYTILGLCVIAVFGDTTL